MPLIRTPSLIESDREYGVYDSIHRQWTMESGQSWTNLRQLAEGHEVSMVHDKEDERITFITTKPSFAIGQTREPSEANCIRSSVDVPRSNVQLF
jgi:hypothetical protein